MGDMMCVCPRCGNIKMDNGRPNCTVCGAKKTITDISYDKYAYEMNNVQRQEWKQKLMQSVKASNEFSEQALDQRLTAEYKERNIEQHQPKCPTCGSTNVAPIGGLERGVSVAALGLFSKKINKSFKCGNCGYTW